MKYILRLLMMVTCVLMMHVTVHAEINYDLLLNWACQPTNVQYNLVAKRTNIQVVDELPWESPELIETWAYTTMNVVPGTRYVSSIDIYIKKGYESALTHEVGHAFSDMGNWAYGWCITPEFIQIWQKERMNCPLLIGQGLTDIREYFACAYDAYIRFPGILKQCCPDTYNYIKVVLNYT